MIGAVILAAGASSRMGAVKALLTLAEGGETLVARIIRLAREGGAEAVVVVLGPPHGERIAATLPATVTGVWNDAPERGMLSSVQTALPALTAAGVMGTLIWPVDVPLVDPRTVQKLLDADLTQLTAPCYQERGGHPLWLPATLFAEVRALDPTGSLRLLRQNHPLARLPVDDPYVLRDLDTPAEFARAQAERPLR